MNSFDRTWCFPLRAGQWWNMGPLPPSNVWKLQVQGNTSLNIWYHLIWSDMIWYDLISSDHWLFLPVERCWKMWLRRPWFALEFGLVPWPPGSTGFHRDSTHATVIHCHCHWFRHFDRSWFSDVFSKTCVSLSLFRVPIEMIRNALTITISRWSDVSASTHAQATILRGKYTIQQILKAYDYIIHLYLIQSIHNFKATRSFTQHACILAFSIHPEYTHTSLLDFLYKHFIEGSKGMGILPKSTIQNIHPAELMVDWITSECKEHQAQYHNITAKLSSIQYWYRAKQIWYSIISIWQYFDVPSMGKCIDRWYATCGGMKSNWHLSRH